MSPDALTGGDRADSATRVDGQTFFADDSSETQVQPGSIWGGGWVAQVRIPVRWKKTGIALQAGNGEVAYTLLVNRRVRGSRLRDVWHMCDMQTPAFNAKVPLVLNNTYKTAFKEDLFDLGHEPQARARSQISSQAFGGTNAVPTLAFFLGLKPFAAPLGPWPESAQALEDVQDTDADGVAGVSLYTVEEKKRFALPRVNTQWTSRERVRVYHVAMRQAFSAELIYTQPNHISGSVQVPEDKGRLLLDVRVIGCETTGHRLCTADEIKLADTNLIAYQADGPARIRMRRLGPQVAIDCQQARALAQTTDYLTGT